MVLDERKKLFFICVALFGDENRFVDIVYLYVMVHFRIIVKPVLQWAVA
jgi:hypothetical protein